ncbi:hypothetical protein BDDG_13047 [Blastomyces dermatitidis ATCC 18188]|uniref:Uncharacterized protein n=1 Tax=Ajellomyces dermatitidis (strain ATCC 18188 / CBS 674.68) TaxID=653446 RepID=A0A0J9EUE6_AJEDA|nr:hypothetical protein BDDG_13047 [Blastomyces dermatitidis ATCC 18188]
MAVCKENKEDEDEDEDGVGLAVADLTVINYYLETLSLFYSTAKKCIHLRVFNQPTSFGWDGTGYNIHVLVLPNSGSDKRPTGPGPSCLLLT